MLNVGIIGLGSFGELHAEAIATIDNIQITAACRTNEVALQDFVKRYGVQGYTDYKRLLADEVDAVLIATPHHLHTHIVKDATVAGKHILLEKPMAPTLEECDEILDAVAKAKVTFMVGHVNHFVPAYQQAKEIIASGEMGEIILGTSTMSKFWFEPNRRSWHLDRNTGGGMWLTAGMHCLDRLTWLIDSPVKRVSAQFKTSFHEQKADDNGLIFLRYANGATGCIVSVAYAEGAPKHLTELTCTKGMINIHPRQGISIGRNEKWKQVPDSQSNNWMHLGLINEWQAFASAIRENKETAVTGEFARHIMATVFAAEESSRLQREVDVPDLQRRGEDD